MGPYLITIVIVLLVLLAKRQHAQKSQATDQPRQTLYGEESCELISSRGLMQLCQVFPQAPKSSEKRLWLSNLGQLQANATVYVPTSALPELARRLEELKSPITLVTGDADEPVDESEPCLKIANHPMVQRWFAQNLALNHVKCRFWPIGLDYHSQASAPMWGAKHVLSPQSQEILLKEVRARAPLWRQRKPLAYCNFQFNMRGGYNTSDRRDAAEQLERSLLVWETSSVERAESWRRMAQCQFVISPHGHGLDCHRTYEALCLGCIPIVKTSPLDGLYRNMPILIVTSWRDLNAEMMAAFANSLEECPSTHPMLRLSYWRKQLAQ